jgi:STE24 endopeptidase
VSSLLSYVVMVYALYMVLKVYISFMQIGYIKDEMRKEAVLLDPEDYASAGRYAVTKEKMSILGSFIEFWIFLFWVGFGLSWLQNSIHLENDILQAVVFVDVLIIINYFIGLPMDIYEKFIVDTKFGFNKMSFSLFVLDSLKGAVLFLIFGSAVIAGIAYFVLNFELWWLYSFIFIFSVIILINMIYPTIIAPLFNKMEPLKDETLKQKIEALLTGVGFKSSGVYSVDASKRDSRLNAYFGGLGATKRVVLFDTLLEKISTNELLAVLGHELGHFKHGDVYKLIAMNGLIMFSFFAILGNIPDQLFNDMFVLKDAGVLIALFLIIMSPLMFMLMPFINYISRKNEFAADAFGSELKSADDLKNALIKLTTENKKFPKSHALYVLFYYTHPSVLERIEAMGGMPVTIETKATDVEFNIFETLGVEKK